MHICMLYVYILYEINPETAAVPIFESIPAKLR